MNCPACNHTESNVLDVRSQSDGAIKRRRRCAACNHRFNTYERCEAQDPVGLHNAAMVARGEIAHLTTILRALDEALKAVTG
ncbi:MAG TPA: hypothetical protein PKE45_20905 [Caldilineaceae bacterium]|nr:hypothetical protein [Caldilineaceae bacterium]